MSFGDGFAGMVSVAGRLLQDKEIERSKQAAERMAPDWYRDAINDAGGDRLRKAYEDLGAIKFGQLDKLAAAFILETGLPPSECELVQKTEGLVTRFWFQQRR